MEREARRGSIHGIEVSRAAPSISHLLFADDLAYFQLGKCEGSKPDSCYIQEDYSRWSGQKVNLAKSALFCTKNTHPVVIEEICNILHVKELGLDSK